MHRLLLTLALTAAVGGLLSPTPAVAQFVPSAKKAERVEITRGPALEMALEDFAIIRWTTNNPGGTERHFGVVYYGMEPNDLSQTAKNPIQLNRAHAETTFRVRMPGLKPQTTYYYKVTSTESNGTSDGVESPVNQFTTPGPGERVVNYPPQPARPK
jgi:phosphodiesterase/alkaline phosphatase D-like protein